MSVDAALPAPEAIPAGPIDSAAPVPALPIGAVVDAAEPALPIAPLTPVEVAPVPGPRSLLGLARAAVGVLAHPYPRRVPRPPMTREEQLAFAENERARLERERQAYRTMALGGGRMR